MKKFMKKYLEFVYDNYIYQDWSDVTKFGKIVLMPAYWIRTVIMSIFCIVGFPIIVPYMEIKEILYKFQEEIN
jgi:hypothetical protein